MGGEGGKKKALLSCSRLESGLDMEGRWEDRIGGLGFLGV